MVDARAKRLEAKARKIDDALAAKAFAAISDVFDQHGMAIQPHQLPREIAMAVKKLKRTEIMQRKGSDGVPELVGHTVEVEMHDQLPALRALGERLRLFDPPPIQTSHRPGFAEILEAAAQRVIEGRRRDLLRGMADRVLPDTDPGSRRP